MDEIIDIDAAYEQLQQLVKERDQALDDCAAEQAAQRTGLASYRRAAALQAEVNEFARKLAAAIERERASL